MTNDAKLGMLVGVVGVVVAAVLFGNPAPPTPEPPAPAKAATVPASAPVATAASIAPSELPRDRPSLPTTPVVRTRKEADAQPTSRRPSDDEEP